MKHAIRATDGTRSIFGSYLPSRVTISFRRLVAGLSLAPILVCAGLLATHGCAADTTSRPLPNLPVPTAGGQQMWTDIAWRDGWRVQRHVWTGHARLLDENDVRRAWGSESACLSELRSSAPPPDEARPERVVVLLHGLWRTRDAMEPLGAAFEDEGFEVLDLAYASARRSIAAHAADLSALLDGLPGENREISFVTHSLGALVVRAMFEGDPEEWMTRHRLGRAVFIAGPNTGPAMAKVGARIPGALAIYGKPSRELARGVAETLPIPPMPFATIAAGRGNEGGWNPWIPGDDDGVVSVTETHLEGEAAWLAVRGSHTFVMRHEKVIECAVSFIDRGALHVSNGRKGD